MTRFACSTTSLSKHPALIVPVLEPPSRTSIRAPGRLYEEPSTLTTVASAQRSPARVAASNASTKAFTSFISSPPLQQLVRRDGQLADAPARGVEDRVGDGRGDADHPQLAHALDPERVDDRVLLLDEQRLDLVHVGVDGDVVVLQVRVHDAAVTVVYLGRLLQGHADAPDDAADLLTVRSLRVDYLAAGRHLDGARDAHRAEVGVNFDLDEL